MSGNIRSVLSRAVPKTREHIDSAQALLADENADLKRFGTVAEKLGKTREILENYSDKWDVFLSGLNPEARAAEEVIQNNYHPGGEELGALIFDAREMETELALKIDELRQARGEPNPLVMGRGPPILPNPGNPVGFSPLPNQGLLEFNGDPSKWTTFWSIFRDQVHRRPNLTGSQKLGYLMGQLKGEARSMIDGYSITDPNYQIVVDALTGRYGDEVRRAHDLRSELLRIPAAPNHPPALRSLNEAIERICRQLSEMGNNMNENEFLITTLREKLPREARMHLLERELDSGRKWTAGDWRAGLTRLVKLKEAAHVETAHMLGPTKNRSSEALHPPKNHQGQNSNGFRPNNVRRAFPVVGIAPPDNWRAPVDRNKPKMGKTPSYPCTFCGGKGHWPSDCRTYPTLEQRRKQLTALNRCTRCLRQSHQSNQCPGTEPCFSCRGNHHRALCPGPPKEKFGQNGRPLKRWRQFSWQSKKKLPTYGMWNQIR